MSYINLVGSTETEIMIFFSILGHFDHKKGFKFVVNDTMKTNHKGERKCN